MLLEEYNKYIDFLEEKFSFYHELIKYKKFTYLVENAKDIMPFIINDLECKKGSWVHINLLVFI